MMQGPQRKMTPLGKIVVVAIVAVSLYGAYRLLLPRGLSSYLRSASSETAPGPEAPDRGAGASPRAGRADVRIGIAYGTEKKPWLEWALGEFRKTPDGGRIDVELIPMGSLEGARAVLGGDNRIHVWSPASVLYKAIFVEEWRLKNGNDPIVREEALALTPMVFVMWAERHEAFVRKYGTVSFPTLSQALAEKSGWKGIAGKPEWGLFKFGHTHPNQSNSGLMTLVLAAYDYHGKQQGLELQDILDPGFQGWMDGVERAVSGLSNSTGTMMKDMVLKGPSAYDALFVYESVVIDFLKNAQGRWGDLTVAYPEKNMWNENPYYILDVPWSGQEHRKAAEAFLAFLMSEPIQQQALAHGFRPGNPAIPIKTAESPFTLFAGRGLRIDLPSVCEPPRAEVINNLLAAWQRGPGSR